MPCDDARLTELPAQENDVVARIVRKIDQAEVDILEDASEGLYLLSRLGHVGRERPQLWVTAHNLAHRGMQNRGIVNRQLVDSRAQRRRLHLKLTHQNFQPWNQLVSFFLAE